MDISYKYKRYALFIQSATGNSDTLKFHLVYTSVTHNTHNKIVIRVPN